MISQTEEQEESGEELEEIRKENVELYTQLEEAKRIEEVLKDKFDEEEQYQKLEMELVGLRKTSEKSNACVKFRNNSIILDEILDCQRSPFDKFGLGYNLGKEKSVADTWTPSKYEVGPSFSKDESQAAPHIPTKTLENLEDIRELVLLLRASSKKIHLQYGTKHQGMNVISMVIVMHVTVLVTSLWIANSMGEEVLEIKVTE